MLDLKIVNELIEDLENSETSLSNIRNLSALYNVKTHLLGTKQYDTVVKELNDILPSYIEYINKKRQYQLQNISIENVLIQLTNVCKEINEFIKQLYAGTDTDEERKLIKEMIIRLKET